MLGWIASAPAWGQRIVNGNYASNTWTSSVFDGTFDRDFGSGAFTVWVNSVAGGFDTSVARASFNNNVNVDELHEDFFVHADFAWDGVGDGNWWYGPKLPVGNRASPGGYENYVVENASRSPEDYDTRFRDQQGAAYLGTTIHDGAVYRHYRKPHREWTQFWAVRQTYRSSGSVSIKPIMEKWRRNGLPNEALGPAKVNIETAGNIDHTFTFFDYYIPGSFRAAPGRSYTDEDHSGRNRLRVRWQNRYLHAPRNEEGVEVVCFNDATWSSQVWDFEPLGQSFYRIRNRWTRDYLTADPSNASLVTLEALVNGDRSQHWAVGRDGNDYRLINRASRLHLHGVGNVNGGAVRTLEQRTWSSQRFAIEPQ